MKSENHNSVIVNCRKNTSEDTEAAIDGTIQSPELIKEG